MQILEKNPLSSYNYFKRMTPNNPPPILRNLDNFPRTLGTHFVHLENVFVAPMLQLFSLTHY